MHELDDNNLNVKVLKKWWIKWINTRINKLNQNKVFSDRVACNILEIENFHEILQEWRNIKYLVFDPFSVS